MVLALPAASIATPAATPTVMVPELVSAVGETIS
jgi:hypothetical protein